MRPWSGRSLLAGPARSWAAGLLACCAVLVIVLGILVAHKATANRVDQAVDAPVMAWFAGHPVVALRMAYPATLVPAGGVSLIAVLACLARGWIRGAVLALLAVPVASGLNDAVLKPLFHRTYEGVLSYPSGHTSAIAALAAALTVLLLLAPRQAPTPRQASRPDLATVLRWVIPAAAWLAVVVVAVGVIGVRWHYFTDTVGGVALGAGTVCGLALALDISWREGRPAAGPGKPWRQPGSGLEQPDQVAGTRCSWSASARIPGDNSAAVRDQAGAGPGSVAGYPGAPVPRKRSSRSGPARTSWPAPCSPGTLLTPDHLLRSFRSG
jgi:membrane-associated phospholipid phosphatase